MFLELYAPGLELHIGTLGTSHCTSKQNMTMAATLKDMSSVEVVVYCTHACRKTMIKFHAWMHCFLVELTKTHSQNDRVDLLTI